MRKPRMHKRAKIIEQYSNKTAEKINDIVYITLAFTVSILIGLCFGGVLFVELFGNDIANSIMFYYLIFCCIVFVGYIITMIATRKYRYRVKTNVY